MARWPARLVLLIAATLLHLATASNNADGPEVKMAFTTVQGYYSISENGRRYEAYEGIPYAAPPIKKLRFKAPQPKTNWPGELKARKLSHDCLQFNHNPVHMKTNPVVGSEDCLYLNIYVPEQKGDPSLLLPVIFYIHGGAFTFGSGSKIEPKYLMDTNVVLVTINYRLGPLGFLSTEDHVVPGNMGLKDQNMALRWVFHNIEYFGGDPDEITLVGCFAGGASVHYHYLSYLSAGLFHNGISLSGTALNSWAYTENALEKAKKLAGLLECPTENIEEMVKCLRYRPAQALVQAIKNFTPWLYNPFTPFGPVVEKKSDRPFIDRRPIETLEMGDIMDLPWITSVSKDDGLYPVAGFAANEKLLKELDENWASIAPHLLNFNHTIPRGLHEETAKKIKDHYVGNNPINRENVWSITKMVGDRLFVVDAEKAARMQAKANQRPVWFYYLTYRGAGSLSDAYSGTKENFGVNHTDDFFYVMNSKYMDPITTESDRAMLKDLLQMWEKYAYKNAQAFAPNWKRVAHSEEKFDYLHIIGPGNFEVSSDDNFGDQKFWRSIDFNENILRIKVKDEL